MQGGLLTARNLAFCSKFPVSDSGLEATDHFHVGCRALLPLPLQHQEPRGVRRSRSASWIAPPSPVVRHLAWRGDVVEKQHLLRVGVLCLARQPAFAPVPPKINRSQPATSMVCRVLTRPCESLPAVWLDPPGRSNRALQCSADAGTQHRGQRQESWRRGRPGLSPERALQRARRRGGQQPPTPHPSPPLPPPPPPGCRPTPSDRRQA